MIPIVAGCKVVVRERFERFGMLRSLAGEKVTVLFGVPFIFEMLASVPPGYRANLSPLRLCISAGAPLSNSVAERFYRRFAVPVRQAYGASHIHPIFTYSLSGVPGTVGHASGPFPAGIMDDRGNTLTAGEVGEIVFDYARLSSRWKRYLRDNPHRMGRYIHSGDLGRIDRDGNLYVVGRKSSFIKVGGNRVEAAEVEDVLRAHPQVSDALVFAHHPGRPDEAVAAVVVTESALSAEEILRHCERRLEGYKCPRMIRFTDNPPRNAHGKIHRGLFEPAPETG
jgi:long-chain acyl-CoA synthetase